MIGSGPGTLLIRIKRLIIQRAYRFTAKAAAEIDLDELTEEDIVESILNAGYVRSKRSTSAKRGYVREKVYIIEDCT